MVTPRLSTGNPARASFCPYNGGTFLIINTHLMLTLRPSIYGTASGIMFLGIAVIHGISALYGWQVTYGQWSLPEGLSWLIALVGFLLALNAIRSLR